MGNKCAGTLWLHIGVSTELGDLSCRRVFLVRILQQRAGSSLRFGLDESLVEVAMAMQALGSSIVECRRLEDLHRDRISNNLHFGSVGESQTVAGP